MIKLKKCPFCGSKKADIRVEANWLMKNPAVDDPLFKAEVICRGCNASIFAFAEKHGMFGVEESEGEPAEAVVYRVAARWNRRPGRRKFIEPPNHQNPNENND